MNQRSKAPARLIASGALVLGFILFVAAIGGSLGGDSSETRSGKPAGKVKRKGSQPQPKRQAAAYVVQNGDTLTSIARKTGVSVSRLQQLNPNVDPQILISGEKLELR